MSKLLQSHWWSTLFILFFPLLVMYAYSDFIRSSELNARLGWVFLIGGVAYLTRHSWLQKFVLAVLVLFVISGSLDILYAVTFGGVFTSASFEAMALTDVGEGVEFLFAYASFENVLVLGLYLTVAYFSLKKVLFRAPERMREKVLAGFGVIMIIVAIQQINQRNRTFDVIPGFSGIAIDFSADQQGIEANIQQRLALYQSKQFSAEKVSDAPQTYVVVIGESLNRNHMQLYGYTRDTTPNLSELKSEVHVFDNAISTHAQTAPSLRVALTEADTQNGIHVSQAISVLGAFKKAGFKTWWITNQQPLRYPTSAIAALADVEHFISHDFHGVEVNRFDEYLLPSVDKALADEAEHKVIFVHLMGSHLQYRNRYPAERSVFNDALGVKAYVETPSRSELAFINAYDNSVHYTDFVVNEMLNALQQKTEIAALTFMSDHGEEVFDSKDFKGHGPDGVTRHMLEVPLLVWRNQAYQQAFPQVDAKLSAKLNESIMLDDFFHFALCVMPLQSSLTVSARSLCSDQYQPKTRIVYGLDYDKELK